MSYEDREASTADGEPFEAIEVTIFGVVYRYTTYPEALVIGSETFEPLAFTRTAVEISSQLTTQLTVDIALPLDSAAARRIAVRNPPRVQVNILRGHVGDDLATEFEYEWRGIATAFSTKRGMVTIKTQSVLQAKMQSRKGGKTYTYSCQHRVYDARCGLSEAGFQTTAVVSRIAGPLVTVNSTGRAAGALVAGTALNVRTGEQIPIFNNTTNTLSLVYAFADVLPGDTLTLTLGCDNKFATCVTRFNNVINFGGYRYMPDENPFSLSVEGE